MRRSATAMLLVAVTALPATTLRASDLTLPDASAAQAEIQIGLCAPPDEIVQALGLRPRGAPIEVWQFDDPELALFARGLRLRLRVAASGHSELTLKVSKQDCAHVDLNLVPPGEGKCEFDVYGASSEGTVSLNRRLGAAATHDLLAGRVAPAHALSSSQIGYLRKVVGDWPLPPGLRALGLMQVRTYRTKDGRYDVDISRLPDGKQFAEISRKVGLAMAPRAMDAMAADLARAGVKACAEQSSQAANKLRALLDGRASRP